MSPVAQSAGVVASTTQRSPMDDTTLMNGKCILHVDQRTALLTRSTVRSTVSSRARVMEQFPGEATGRIQRGREKAHKVKFKREGDVLHNVVNPSYGGGVMSCWDMDSYAVRSANMAGLFGTPGPLFSPGWCDQRVSWQ
ncbi:uncharacterized protein LOC122251897 [Penaeus japonicus]|uniref:uncharacterized protein LOC122251897 n=1 Tax=Penaeus japonicus TaxID=27405 RepID=UPI001C712563|nr:uncharacterized protein LOC122251897 [Penaeus japonicus]